MISPGFRRKLAVLFIVVIAAPASAGEVARIPASVPAVYVVDGDAESLSAISQELFGNAKYWKKIAGWNHLGPPYKIKKGQQLVIHEILKKASKHFSAPATALPSGVKGSFRASVTRELKGKIYTVNERAPSISMVALELYGNEQYKRGLIRENKLRPPYSLKLGQKLRLPLPPKHSSEEGTAALVREWERLGNVDMVVRLKATLPPEASRLADSAPGITPEAPGAAPDSEETTAEVKTAADTPAASLRAPPAPPPAAGPAVPITEKTIAATPDSPHALVVYPQAAAADPTPRARDVTLALALTLESTRVDAVDKLSGAEGLFLTNTVPGVAARVVPALRGRDSVVAEAAFRSVSFRDNSQAVPFLNRKHNQLLVGGGFRREFPGLAAEALLRYRNELFAHGVPNYNQVEMVSVGVLQAALRAEGELWRGEKQALLGLFSLSLLGPASGEGVKASPGYRLGAGVRWRQRLESSSLLADLGYSLLRQDAGHEKKEQTIGLLLGLEWGGL